MNTDWILPISRSDDQAWLKLLQVYSSPDTSTSERITARTDFLSETNRAAIIQSHLIKDLAWSLALSLVEYLTVEESIPLLPELIHRYLNCRLGDLLEVRGLILRLPQETLVADIERLCNSYLANNTDDQDWLDLLNLYEAIDPALVRRLARKAKENASEEIRLLGVEFTAEDKERERPGQY